MTETQKSSSDALELAFGFGNVRASMRYGEGLPREEFFVGLNGICSVEVKDSDAFARKFSGRDTVKKLRAAVMPIIEKAGTQIIRNFAETGKIYFSDIRSHAGDIGKAVCKLCKSAEIASLGISVTNISIDGIIARRASDPAPYTLCKPARLSPAARLVLTALLCAAFGACTVFLTGKASPHGSQSESSFETIGKDSAVTTTPAEATTTQASTATVATSTSETTIAQRATTQTTSTETKANPDKEHYDGEKFEYDDMTIRIENGKCIIEKYNGSAAEVYIPDEIDGYAVYRLEENSFYGCTSLEKIRLPETLIEIGGGAFHSCVFLQTIDIPKNVRSIMNYAFAYCSSLKEVEVPDSVEEMGYCVFMNCIVLERAVLGGNYDNFDNIFLYCYKLNYVELPDGIKLMDGFRDCESLEEIHIPSSVRLIRGGAFSGCTKLKRVYLTDNMIVEKDAFGGCDSITFYLYADKIPDGYGDGWMPENSSVQLAKEGK